MKFSYLIMAVPLSVVVLSACSGDPAKRRQANNSFDYSDSQLMPAWSIANDAQLQTYPMYNIPTGNYEGDIADKIDIRSPQLVFNLIPGARIDGYNNGTITWLRNEQQLDEVWQLILTLMEVKNIPIERLITDTPEQPKPQTEQTVFERNGFSVKPTENQTPVKNMLETGWVDLSLTDETVQMRGRYDIHRVEQDGRYGIFVSVIEWQEEGKDIPLTVPVQQRYSAVMTNMIANQYDLQQQEAERLKALQELNSVPIMMGRDSSGLPIIIARSEYDVVWARLENSLIKMGFETKNKNQSQGTIETAYRTVSEEKWATYNLTPLDWENGDYNFIIGDLENRTSINVNDRDGRPLSEEQLQQLLPILDVLLDNNSH